MNNNSSREQILNRIAAASQGRPANIFSPTNKPVYKPIEPNAVDCFINELTAVNGKCILCENEQDLYQQLKEFVDQEQITYLFCRDSYIRQQLSRTGIPCSGNEERHFECMEAGITGCELLIARTGSVVVSSATESGRQMNVFPPIHIVLAHVSQLVNYPTEAYQAILEKYDNELPSVISTITGPSRTADIEKTLVLGAHGPKVFVVFLCKN